MGVVCCLPQTSQVALGDRDQANFYYDPISMKTSWLLLLCCASVFVTSLLAEETLQEEQERGLSDSLKDAWTGYQIVSLFGKRDQNEVEKRGWESALGRVMGRDTENEVEKRGWKSALGRVMGRDTEDKVEKRGWKSMAAGAAAGALLGKKRDNQDQVGKRGWKSMAAGAAAGYFLGKKRDSQDQVEKRGKVWQPGRPLELC